MRKVLGLIILLVSILIMLTAMNRSFISRVKQDRYFDHLDNNIQNNHSLYHSLFIRSDRWDYGDLYGECYLPAYRYKLEPFKQYVYDPKKTRTNKILYIIGDSYLADKTLTSAFKKFDNVIYLDRRFPFGSIVLDSTKQNYLLLEFAERNLNADAPDSTATAKNLTYNVYQPEAFMSRINKILFNKELSRNIELLLFDDKLFTPFKELKAWLNYSLFKRVNKEVTVSTDKKRLLMNITVDTTDAQSAFRFRTDQYINTITTNLDKTKAYYNAIGFKDVFLAIIPNPVSVYDDHRMTYNHLLQRVEQKTDLPKISMYNIFKSSYQNMYYLSDSHWNPLGFDTWVRQANNVFNNNLK